MLNQPLGDVSRPVEDLTLEAVEGRAFTLATPGGDGGADHAKRPSEFILSQQPEQLPYFVVGHGLYSSWLMTPGERGR